MSTRIGLFVVFLLAAGLASCGGDDDSPVTPPIGSDTRVVVEMRDNVFFPANVEINFGDTVQWVNVGTGLHTATSGAGCAEDGVWDSGTLSRGGRFMAIFDINHINVTGTFPYYCEFHCAMGMTGAVTVNPAP